MADPTSGHSVLIVDDDMTLREMYQEYLTASGFTVLSAQNGQDGLKMAEESHPSVILLDLMMPEMNGLEVLRILKKQGSGMDTIPVIVFTALIQDLEKRECFAAGASDYVVKTDVTPKEILEKMRGLITKDSDAAPAPQAA